MKKRFCSSLLGLLALFSLFLQADFVPVQAVSITTTRVSVARNGAQGNDHSYYPSISADGRYVVFYSNASNLVSGDTNGYSDIFVHDRQTGTTTRVSVASDGAQGNNDSSDPSISVDGRFVVFDSYASNLVSGDTNGYMDVFVHDQQTGSTTRISVASDGEQGNEMSYYPTISADGRFVVFNSYASNLVGGDTNGYRDVFIHDRQTGTTTRVSIANDGAQANNSSYGSISSDGRYVAFCSDASNLVSGDTNVRADIFVHDQQTGVTTRVSVASDGAEGNHNSYDPTMSQDGQFVAFYSEASNLVNGDTNGYMDVFVHDRQTGATTRVSVASDGAQGNGQSDDTIISTDGRFVAFRSDASNLVNSDTNGYGDIFVHDRQMGATKRVSVASDGAQGNERSYYPTISADGLFVAFQSSANNLVSGDTNGVTDVFVFDRTNTNTISGHIQDGSGNPISGLPVSAGSGYSATTNASGDYTITNLPPGTYTVTPSKTGYTFLPSSRSATVPPDGSSINFTASGIYTLSGHIQDGSGSAINGVTVSAGSWYSSTTDASGNYTFSNMPPGTYTITPSKSGFAFSPSTRSVTLPPNATGINFTGGPPPPTLVSPNNGSTVTTWTPTYTWNDIPEATYFKLYVGKPDYSMTFASWYTRAQANCDGTTCFVTPDAAIVAGQNKWCVKSYNSGGGAWSSWWSFNSPTSYAAVPILGSPAEGETVSTWTPTFTWNDDPNATLFKLWVGKPDGRMTFAQWYTRAQANCDEAHCSVTPSAIINPGQNRWYVKSYNPNGGAWSNPMNFYQDNLLVSPADGSTVSDTWKPTYTWKDITSITGFNIWIGLPDGTRKFYKYYSRTDANCNNTTCHVMPNYTLVNGQNRWYIEVYTSSGNRYSDPATFTRP